MRYNNSFQSIIMIAFAWICVINPCKIECQNAEMFILENKGQISGEQGYPEKDVLYYAKSENFVCYITKAGIYYQLLGNNGVAEDLISQNDQKIKPLNDVYTFNLEFVEQNPDAEIIPGEVNPYYEIYYLNGNEISVKSYSFITIKNIYPHIDCKYYIDKGNLKYDLIINDAGTPNDIKIIYKGVEGIRLQNESKLTIQTTAGTLIENIPVSYYTNDMEKFYVDCRYKVSGDTVSFILSNQQNNWNSLVIDPVLNWEATIGASATDVYGTTVDQAGNIYIAGQTSALSGISLLGFQNTKSTGLDGFLAKYNAFGVKLWATYYGNTGTDKGLSVATDASNNIYLAGSTTSSTGIASGGFQNSLGGLSDGFIVKFNSSGSRIWSTYFGGTGDDGINSIAVNNSGHIIIGGTTSSSTAIASGGYKLTYSGSNDCFVAKFDLSGSLIWSTYYGGSGSEADASVTFDKWENIYLTGTTTSVTDIAFSGLVNTYQGGVDDAFYAKFTNTGVLQFASYLGGANSDYAKACTTDTSGNFYIAGTTVSSTGIALSGHQNTHGTGYWDAYLIKFNPDGDKLWGTYYGGNNFDLAGGVTCDKDNNVFLCGKTVSVNNISNGGYLLSYPGDGASYTSFLAKFNSEGILNWGTYYGSTNPNYGQDVSTDTIGNVYLGAYYFTYGGRLLQYKNINYEIDIKTLPDTLFCQGDKLYVKFDAYGIYNPDNYFITQISDSTGAFVSPYNLGENHISNHGSIVSALPFDLPASTAYRIRVVSTSPYYESIQSLETIEILPSPVVEISTPPVLAACAAEGVLLSADSIFGLSYKWYRNGIAIPGATNHAYLATTTGNYFVKVKNPLCDFKSENFAVTIFPASTTYVDETFCEGGSYTLPDGATVYSPGSYISVLPSVLLCDSIIHTNLTYAPDILTETEAVICSGSDYLLPDGTVVTTDGIYVSNLESVDGCDSTVITNLTSLTTYDVFSNLNICAGDSVLLTNGSYVNESGVYSDTYEAGGVCIDFTTDLEVTPDYVNTEYIIITEGETYILPGGGIALLSGIYIDSLITAGGCDSVIITNLTVVPDGCNPPIGINVSAITSSTAVVSWTAAFDATKYDIYYRIAGLIDWQKKSSTFLNKTLTGLSPGSTYEYKVRTVCGIENSIFSPVATFITLPMKAGESINEIQVFPTVNAGCFSIDLTAFPFDDVAEINCFNVAGQLVYSSNQNCGNIVSFDLKGIAAGPVLIEIANSSVTTMKWIVIQ